jgi:hypothetical protein
MECIIDSLDPQFLAIGYKGHVKYKLNIFSINATWTHGISLSHHGLPHVSSFLFLIKYMLYLFFVYGKIRLEHVAHMRVQ